MRIAKLTKIQRDVLEAMANGAVMSCSDMFYPRCQGVPGPGRMDTTKRLADRGFIVMKGGDAGIEEYHITASGRAALR